MCRLFGIYGKVDGWRTAAREFGKLAEFGNVPSNAKTPGHRDGWGMAWSSDDGTAMLEGVRRMGSAHEAAEYGDVISALKSQPHIFLCHLRKASPGVPVTMGNVHPFVRKGWALIHNGTIFNPEALPPNPSFRLVSDGSDSERLFAWLSGILSRKKNSDEWSAALAKALPKLNIDYTGLNCIFSNGSELFAVRDYQSMGDYLSLYYCAFAAGVIVCSEPLAPGGLDSAGWQPLVNRSILRIAGTPPRIEVSTY